MIKGKGIFAWILKLCENGDMGRVVAQLKKAGMTHIIPKIADGISGDLNGNQNYLADLVRLAHNEGIRVLGYHYVYGYSPAAEAERIVSELKRAPFDGLVINAEHQYRDLPNNREAARRYCSIVRQNQPHLPLALSTYRFPSLHSKFPFTEFLTWCDYNMPQVYWMKANGTVPAQLSRTIAEYKLYPAKPMIPTGAAFQEHGWKAIASDQVIFIKEAQKHGLQGCNWWEYRHTFNLLPHLGQAIIDTPWEVETEPIPDPEPPIGGDTMFVIEMLGHLRIRQTPNGNVFSPEQYALRGETHHSNEKAQDEQGRDWYKIVRNGITGWISGTTQWTRITPVAGNPDPDPDPEPLTLEERVTRIEKHLGLT